MYRMGMELARSVIERHGERRGSHARRVTIQLHPTDDATHGAKQLSFFNACYDHWCYLPMMGFVSFDDEPDHYLCAAVLRSANVAATAGVLRRLIEDVDFRILAAGDKLDLVTSSDFSRIHLEAFEA